MTQKMMYSYEGQAEIKLSAELWAYLAGGSETETALRRNRSAFERLAMIPRILVDTQELDMSVSFLGKVLSSPIMLAPVGSLHLLHDSGFTGICQAAVQEHVSYAGSSNVPQVKTSQVSAESSAFYQLYVDGDDEWLSEQCTSAIQRGASGVIITVDTPVFPVRYRDVVTQNHASMRNLNGSNPYRHGLSWEVITRLIRNHPSIPILIKGIQDVNDAVHAYDCGAAAVWVSNHGGRQYDQGPATIDLLPAISSALNKRIPLIVDGGFRSGNDVLKALALGADIIAIGRAYLYPFALGGTTLLVQYLQDLKKQISTNMTLLGVNTLKELANINIISTPFADALLFRNHR